MAEEKGILTITQEQKLATVVDEALKLKGILELIDGYVAKVVITLLDDKVLDKIKVEIKIKLAALVDAVIAEDIALAEELSADLVNSLIDIPGLDETSEGLIFKGAIELVVGAILSWIEKKKGEEVVLKLA